MYYQCSENKSADQLRSHRDLFSDMHVVGFLMGRLKSSKLLINFTSEYLKIYGFITNRIEAIMRKMQSRVPFLSEPERNMKRELESMDEKLETYQRNLEQVSVFSYFATVNCNYIVYLLSTSTLKTLHFYSQGSAMWLRSLISKSFIAPSCQMGQSPTKGT